MVAELKRLDAGVFRPPLSVAKIQNVFTTGTRPEV
jgi:hypothetical protein